MKSHYGLFLFTHQGANWTGKITSTTNIIYPGPPPQPVTPAPGAAAEGWAVWDWKAGFTYWDARRSQPLPGMRAALGLE